MECVIHHKACKCREERFKHLDKENIVLHQTVAEQWTEIQKLKKEIKLATESINDMATYVAEMEGE